MAPPLLRSSLLVTLGAYRNQGLARLLVMTLVVVHGTAYLVSSGALMKH